MGVIGRMSRGAGVGLLLLVHAMTGAAFAQSPAEICSAADKRVSCSMQCCGRRSCPPSCEIDCVKACVDACASPARMDDFLARLRSLQQRCGNRAAR